MRADEYLHRLIALGHRVAVCEQLEDPAEAKKRGSKSVVRRDVVRLVTPGTLTEDTLLDARRNNYLLAIARARLSSAGEDDRFALAWIDISTGEFRITECDRAVARRPRSRGWSRARSSSPTRSMPTPTSCRCWRALPAVTPLTRDVFDGATAERRLTVVLRGRDQRSLRRAVAARTDRGRGLRHLCRAHADRQAPAAVAAVARKRRRHDGDRPGDPRQSRTDAHAVRRAARLAAGGDRPHRDLGRLAPAGATTVGAAHRSRRRSRGGSMRSRASSTTRPRAPIPRSRLQAAPDLARALSRLARRPRRPARSRRHPRRRAAPPPISRARLASLKDTPAEIAEALQSCRRPDGMLAAELSAALAAELPAFKRDGGFVREGYDAALDETRALARRIAPRGRRLAGALCRRDRHARPQDPPQQRARLFRRGHRPARRQADGRAAQCDLHPPPDAGRPGALHHHRTGRAGSQDRQRRRPRARAGAGDFRAARRAA